MSALVLGFSGPVLAAEKVPVVVLPIKPTGGQDLAKSVRKNVEPALSRVAKVLPRSAYVKAAAKAGFALSKMATARAIKKIGPEIGAKAVLLVEGIVKTKRVGKKRRKKKSVFARVALIEVSSGRLLFTQTYGVDGKAISGALARRIADATARHLKKIRVNTPKPASAGPEIWAQTSPANLPEPEPAPEPEKKAKPKPAYEEVPAAPVAKASDPWAVATPAPKKAQDPWAAPTPAPAAKAKPSADPWAQPSSAPQGAASNSDAWGQNKAPAQPAAGWGEQSAQPQAQPQEQAQSGEWGSSAEPAKPKTAFDSASPSAPPTMVTEARPEEEAVVKSPFRPALRFSIGGASLRRQAAVPDPDDLGRSKLDYGLGDGWVFSPGASAMLDIFPLRFAGSDSILSGLGLSFDGSFFMQSTQQVDLSGGALGESMTSQVMSLRGGLVWSLGLWSEDTAPVVSMEAGFHHYGFPLDDAPFPGVSYSGPYGAIEFALPVAESAALCFSAAFTAPLGAGGDLTEFGAANGGYGFGSGVELFISLASLVGAPIELRLGADYDSYTLRFTGDTSFQGVNLSDAEIRDVAWQGYAALGFSL